MKKFVTILSLFVFGVSTVFSNQDTLINDSVGSSATSIDEGLKETIKIDESIFHNVSAKGIEEGAKIMWSIDYDVVSYLEGNNYSIVIASVEAIYIDKVTKDISALAISRGIDWKIEKGISIKETSFTIKELKGITTLLLVTSI
jgi:hypothetical protein